MYCTAINWRYLYAVTHTDNKLQGRTAPLYMNHDVNCLLSLWTLLLFMDWDGTQSGYIHHMHTLPYLSVTKYSLGHDPWLFPANLHPESSLFTE